MKKFGIIAIILFFIIGSFALFKDRINAPVVVTDTEESGSLERVHSVIESKNMGEIKTEESESGRMQPGLSTSSNQIATTTGSQISAPKIKEFIVEAASFSFTPSNLSVNKGDTVKITVKNLNGSHDLRLDEFGVSTRILKAGESETITFTADKIGTFEYYCSVGSHRSMGMVGTLVIN